MGNYSTCLTCQQIFYYKTYSEKTSSNCYSCRDVLDSINAVADHVDILSPEQIKAEALLSCFGGSIHRYVAEEDITVYRKQSKTSTDTSRSFWHLKEEKHNEYEKTVTMLIPKDIYFMVGCVSSDCKNSECLPGGGMQVFIPLPIAHSLWTYTGMKNADYSEDVIKEAREIISDIEGIWLGNFDIITKDLKCKPMEHLKG